MDINLLIGLVSILITLSIASERLVEIIKGFIPYLNIEQTDPKAEARRKALIHILSVTSGVITAFLAKPILAGIINELFKSSPPNLDNFPLILALGLLASGGSGLWNSVLEYLLKIKNLKEVKVERAKIEAVKAEALMRTDIANAQLQIQSLNQFPRLK